MEAFLADFLVGLHLVVLVFMVGGLVLVIAGWPLRWRWVRNPWFRFIHLAIAAYIVFNALRDELCFLTIWEGRLRERAGQQSPGDISFVGRVLRDALYVELEPRILNRLYIAFGALALVSLLFVRPRFSGSEGDRESV